MAEEPTSGYLLSEDAMRRIVRAVLSEEARRKNDRPAGPHRQDVFYPVKKGKLDGSLAFGGTQTVSIWRKNSNGSEADTTEDVTAVNHWFNSTTIASGKKVHIMWIEG